MSEEDPPLQSELEEIVDQLEEKVMGRVVEQSRDEDDDTEPVATKDEPTDADGDDEPAD